MRYSLRQIAEAVSVSLKISMDDLCGPNRTRREAHARWIAFHLSREMTGYSYPQIGRFYGRTHGPVWHGARNAAAMVASRPGFAVLVDNCRAAVVARGTFADLTRQRLAAQRASERQEDATT